MLQGDSLGCPATEAGAGDVVCIDRATLREIVRRVRGLEGLIGRVLAAAPAGEDEEGVATAADRAGVEGRGARAAGGPRPEEGGTSGTEHGVSLGI